MSRTYSDEVEIRITNGSLHTLLNGCHHSLHGKPAWVDQLEGIIDYDRYPKDCYKDKPDSCNIAGVIWDDYE